MVVVVVANNGATWVCWLWTTRLSGQLNILSHSLQCSLSLCMEISCCCWSVSVPKNKRQQPHLCTQEPSGPLGGDNSVKYHIQVTFHLPWTVLCFRNAPVLANERLQVPQNTTSFVSGDVSASVAVFFVNLRPLAVRLIPAPPARCTDFINGLAGSVSSTISLLTAMPCFFCRCTMYFVW